MEEKVESAFEKKTEGKAEEEKEKKVDVLQLLAELLKEKEGERKQKLVDTLG